MPLYLFKRFFLNPYQNLEEDVANIEKVCDSDNEALTVAFEILTQDRKRGCRTFRIRVSQLIKDVEQQ